MCVPCAHVHVHGVHMHQCWFANAGTVNISTTKSSFCLLHLFESKSQKIRGWKTNGLPKNHKVHMEKEGGQKGVRLHGVSRLFARA